jgi:hypothetical protein
MRRASFTSGLVSETPSNGARQPSMSCLGFREFPEVDQAGTSVGEPVVDGMTGLDRVDTSENILLAEYVVDRLQDRRARPERIGEGYRIELQPGTLELLLQRPAPQVELAGRSALKRKDRLLLVADGEHGSHQAVARASA